jgi:hypothetical protein
VLEFQSEEVESDFKAWLRYEESLVMQSRLKLVSLVSFLTAAMNLWVFGKLIWNSPYGRLKIEKIQRYIAIVASLVWTITVPAGLVLGNYVNKQMYYSSRCYSRAKLERI